MKYRFIDSRSSAFQRQVERLGRKYRRLTEDLASALSIILSDPLRAAHAAWIPGFQAVRGKVVKYRFASQDRRKGGSGGFRLIALVVEETMEVYPLCLYTKEEYESQPPRQLIQSWLEDLQMGLNLQDDL